MTACAPVSQCVSWAVDQGGLAEKLASAGSMPDATNAVDATNGAVNGATGEAVVWMASAAAAEPKWLFGGGSDGVQAGMTVAVDTNKGANNGATGEAVVWMAGAFGGGGDGVQAGKTAGGNSPPCRACACTNSSRVAWVVARALDS